MNKVTIVGIDLAKRVFALHGVEDGGRVVLRRLCKPLGPPQSNLHRTRLRQCRFVVLG